MTAEAAGPPASARPAPVTALTDEDRRFLALALEEARLGYDEGGIPIGSVLVVDGEVRGRGHNRRVQRGSAILHGEMDALEAAGRLPATMYRRATIYTTLSPCPMCSGAIRLYEIPRVVVGERRTFVGDEAVLAAHGVAVVHADDDACHALLQRFIAERPDVWAEDIGEEALG